MDCYGATLFGVEGCKSSRAKVGTATLLDLLYLRI